MTAADRARMRDTLRAALTRARLPDAARDHPGPIAVAARGDDRAVLTERFLEELVRLGGTAHEADGVDAVVEIVLAQFPSSSPREVLAWDDGELPVRGLRAALERAGVVVRVPSATDVESSSGRAALAAIAVGLTGADAGLAQTGSIVLASGPGRSRLASLLPPVHVALLRRGDIVDALPDLIRARPALATAGANLVCITGPSRTADIEHVLARGVHGPKDVHVVLVD